MPTRCTLKNLTLTGWKSAKTLAHTSSAPRACFLYSDSIKSYAWTMLSNVSEEPWAQVSWARTWSRMSFFNCSSSCSHVSLVRRLFSCMQCLNSLSVSVFNNINYDNDNLNNNNNNSNNNTNSNSINNDNNSYNYLF